MNSLLKTFFYFFTFLFLFSPASLLADGFSLYRANCAKCHGQEGEGGKAYALNKEGLLITTDMEYLIGSIKYGRPLSGCPPHEGLLSKSDTIALAAYIKGWQKGEMLQAPDHQVSPQDNQRGKELFPICGACHGLKTEGAMGPPLFDDGFLRSASDQVIRRTIMYGRPGTPMKGFTKGYGPFPLSMADIDNIISYMRFRQTTNQAH